MIEVFDFEQGTIEWFEARRGIATASRFSDLLAKGEGKMRRRYMLDLAAEIITGRIAESYTNGFMERGHEQEDEARKMYALLTEAEPMKVGFVRNGNVGASPDSLLGEDGGLEIKTAMGAIQIDRLDKGVFPAEHRAQVQGSMWVTGRSWWDFVSYCPGLPLLALRVERDDAYIANLAAEVESFNADVATMVERIKGYGA